MIERLSPWNLGATLYMPATRTDIVATIIDQKIDGLRSLIPRFYVSTSKSIIKALINMHSFEIQLSPIG
ncbi:TPA: HpcH/HpaI aldolase/citrate lyase family protein [Proteus mirabilis]|nr:HpcH/HpaI aldolase/citrate lyase family protein [Proteus mirabilis]HAT5558601.1 HpcH/HpaI aldolase/citrate lyase family protein [Proteus mirabilis]